MSKPLPQTADFLKNSLNTSDHSVLQELANRKSLEITQSLQTTLDPTRLIEIFSAEVGALIVHQGIRYRNDDIGLDLKLGSQARHACSYHLNIGDEPLGRLSFRRNQKFTEAEIEVLEQLLCSLLYPLRNGLLYEDALQLAQKDPLTGICNRAALDEMLQRELSHALRKDAALSLLVLDIDHFKKINDQYGHIIGDCALKSIANRVSACKRDGDLLFRYGGEEFVVLMRDTDLAGAQLLAERIRQYIADSNCNCSGAELNVTVSIGVSELQQDDNPLSLFSRADQALYRAKKNGRNQVCSADN